MGPNWRKFEVISAAQRSNGQATGRVEERLLTNTPPYDQQSSISPAGYVINYSCTLHMRYMFMFWAECVRRAQTITSHVTGHAPGLGSKYIMAGQSSRVLLNLGLRDGLNMNARALITTLLSTTAVAAAHSSSSAGWAAKASSPGLSVKNHPVKRPSPSAACCYPATYSSVASHWTRQSCLASDLLELHHTARYTGRPAPAPSRPLTSGYSSSDEEEECLQWYDIDTPEFVQLVDGEKLQLFDVREPEELEETGIIPGAINLPRKQLFNIAN